ncbi:SDR family oxidoreductase [Mycobacterium sp.]|jgi:NAD(P)-dependent dehydrogenase (short-subunit alcohol dehydrogenase family)|uniref:SDR family oxidoreductase n=1 Tax=Mycobacterium sp. TaxID=1785 RepID=UPI002C2E5A53|nr:SDR family oxidoreductase [Mycobacterium sp.]HTH85142.1 SDR family oxidoreductase [Mycobacterium sp.]
MSGLLDGKVVLINGGTQGVGGASARAAVREGAQVVVTGRRLDAGKRFAAELEELGGDVRFVQTDMADPQQARRSVTRTVEEFGRIDGLCNAAGITTRGTLLDTTPELFDTHIAVNLRGPFFAMQAAAADMIERGTEGSIVNIISIAEHGGQGYLAPYVAAKAGLAGLTRNAAYAHRWDRIRINGLNIGWTESEGESQTQQQFHQADDGWAAAAAKKVPMGKLGQPDEIAEIVVLLLSPRSGVVTGSVIDWDQIVIGGHD